MVNFPFLSDLAQDFLALRRAARRRRGAAFAKGTKRNQIMHFRTYLAFCVLFDRQPFSPSQVTLETFIEFLCRTFQSS